MPASLGLGSLTIGVQSKVRINSPCHHSVAMVMAAVDAMAILLIRDHEYLGFDDDGTGPSVNETRSRKQKNQCRTSHDARERE